ncbi:NAD(P)/FAD-dependent oxidoreductase [Halovivax cerinus]|uniref:NAD(P)/FAD-dependent oxidoreductase n=1 Tax=Halovivax cerinus TaxID=1487865 RepID=A0ABD5NP58_9EURY|nr:FAD-dependent oxidoreductase [Halovivax cerinus]
MHVVVAGGGIVGTAASYYLARRGIDVTVCEKSHVGAGSTGAGGGIRSQFSTPVNVELSRHSMEVWADFDEEFGVDVRERTNGYLFLARTDESADQLRRDVSLQREHGFPNEFLDPAEAAAHCPGLDASRYVGASYSPRDRFVSPTIALNALADASEAAGSTFEIGTEITDVLLEGTGPDRSVCGVETGDGRIECDYVVDAAGPWAGRILDMVSLRLPIEPRLRYQLLVRPGDAYEPDLPLTMDVDTGSVFYPEDDEVMIASAPQEQMPRVDPGHTNADPSTEWTIDVLEGLGEMADFFTDETRVQREISGVYAQTPDGNPILDEPLPGFVVAAGFSGHGFMHAPATGQLVAEMVDEGSPSLVDISSLSADRFADRSPDAERSFI